MFTTTWIPTLPKDLGSVVANRELDEKFHMGAAHMLLLDVDTDAADVREMAREMEAVDGVSFVLGTDSLLGR